MSGFGSPVALAPPAPRPPAEILWACENGGTPRFPGDIATIYARRQSPSPRHLDAFQVAVREAQTRVWMLDGYLFLPEAGKGSPDYRILTILDWLHVDIVANDIKILTGDHKEVSAADLRLFKDRENDINKKLARRGPQCSITVSTHLSRVFDIHDRFAVIDDELWHFGATVGGFHTSVNAASRGWPAGAVGAIKFFELAWAMSKGKT